MATPTATKRLRQDYLRLMRDPVPYIEATPLHSNILQWHYVVKGPEDTPYAGGYYHGKLVFPRDYPFKPPRIIMITPSGRFQTNTRLCLSISDFHPDSWNPAWSVATILTGLLSFMVEKTSTLGSVATTEEVKKQLAVSSWSFNLRDKEFCTLFPHLCEEVREKLKEREERRKDGTLHDEGLICIQSSSPHNGYYGPLGNMLVIVLFIGFAFTVHYLLQLA